MIKSKEQILSEVSDKKYRDEVLQRMMALSLKSAKKKKETATKPKETSTEPVKSTENVPESLIMLESEHELRSSNVSSLRWFYSNEAYDFSSAIFTPLTSACPASQLNLANLKRLAILKMETNTPCRTWLINLSGELVELEISMLHFNSNEANEELQVNLPKLRSFSIARIEGCGRIRFVTPELSDFQLNWILPVGRGFSEFFELAFPEKLKRLSTAEYPPSIEQFEHLEILECNDQLPDNVLTAFENLKHLKYSTPKSSGYLLEFLFKRDQILSILKHKKRLRRTQLVIVFYGVLLEDERQLDFSDGYTEILDLTGFYLRNYAKLCDCLVDEINYSSLISFLSCLNQQLPEDFHLKFCHIRIVSVTNAVERPDALLRFLGALRNPVSLKTCNTNLTSSFYDLLAQVAVLRELEIFRNDKPIDFNFLLKLNALQKFSTDLALSLELIEQLLSRLSELHFIQCKFKQRDILIERENGSFSLLDKFRYKKFVSLKALIKELPKRHIRFTIESENSE